MSLEGEEKRGEYRSGLLSRARYSTSLMLPGTSTRVSRPLSLYCCFCPSVFAPYQPAPTMARARVEERRGLLHDGHLVAPRQQACHGTDAYRTQHRCRALRCTSARECTHANAMHGSVGCGAAGLTAQRCERYIGAAKVVVIAYHGYGESVCVRGRKQAGRGATCETDGRYRRC